MCGLVGYATGSVTKSENDFLRAALIADTVRGSHSTGLAMCCGKKQQVYKKAVNGASFVKHKPFEDFCNAALRSTEPVAMIGHNRYATIGNITDTTAHPFTHGDITGVHNGTLWEHEHLADGAGRKFAVDSEAVIYALNHSENYVDVLEDLPGAFALVWHDARSNRLHFARNSERSLYIAESTDGEIVLWASEELMLRWIIDRSFVATKFEMWELPVGEVWEYDMSQKKLADTTLSTPFTPTTDYYGKKYSGGYDNGWAYYRDSHKDRRKFKCEQTMYEKTGNLIKSYRIHEDVAMFPTEPVEFLAEEFIYYSKDPSNDINGRVFGKCVDPKTGAFVEASMFMNDYDFEEGAIYIGDVSCIMDYSNLGISWYVCNAEKVETLEYTLVDGTVADVDEVAEAIDDGCPWCKEPITMQDIKSCGRTYGQIVCPSCAQYTMPRLEIL